MTLTLKGLNKKGTAAIYAGLKSTVRIALVNFPGKIPSQTIDVAGDLVAATPAKAKLSAEEKEQRKAERKAKRDAEVAARREAKKNAAPLTLAQRVAKAEERAAKMRAKLEAASAQPASAQPVM